MSRCCCQSAKPIQLTIGKVCPVCGEKGQKVSYKTVSHLIQKEKVISEDEYHICMTPDCEVVYYSDTDSIGHSELSVPVWFKKGADPVILCYCSNLTDEDFRKASRELKSYDTDEIIKHLGGMENCDCENNNPTGRCCIGTISSFVESLES